MSSDLITPLTSLAHVNRLKKIMSTMPPFPYLYFFDRDTNIQWGNTHKQLVCEYFKILSVFWEIFWEFYNFFLCTRVVNDTHFKWGNTYGDKQLVCEYFKFLSVFWGIFWDSYNFFLFFFVFFMYTGSKRHTFQMG